ncbi:hypothetical protein C170_27963 [Paenibacillus sp. FSL H7-689]|nr:hypothetical protein C170_27963 [Paenibacillus sp. FSL H7-689]
MCSVVFSPGASAIGGIGVGSDDLSIGLFVELSIMSAPFMSIQFLYVAPIIPPRGIYQTEN